MNRDDSRTLLTVEIHTHTHSGNDESHCEKCEHQLSTHEIAFDNSAIVCFNWWTASVNHKVVFAVTKTQIISGKTRANTNNERKLRRFIANYSFCICIFNAVFESFELKWYGKCYRSKPLIKMLMPVFAVISIWLNWTFNDPRIYIMRFACKICHKFQIM